MMLVQDGWNYQLVGSKPRSTPIKYKILHDLIRLFLGWDAIKSKVPLFLRDRVASHTAAVRAYKEFIGPERRCIPMRQATRADADSICRIYNHYVENSIATFEKDPVTTTEMTKRIEEIATTKLPWLVEETNGQIIGYAYASKWKTRPAYQYSVETTIYLASNACGAGIGTQLYTKLLLEVKTLSMHVAIGGIALPNDASIRLHEKLGYRKVAEFCEVGMKFGKWINVGYWQLKL